MSESEIILKVWNLCKNTLGPDYSLYLFGSRAKGTHTPTSDFDLLVRGKTAVPEKKWSQLIEKASELNTLYKIDLVDYHRIEEKFRTVIEKQLKEIINGQVRT